MTEKLYYQNVYQKSFTAKVLNCYEEKGKYYAVLDRTCFYPEGGGQNADTGKINGIDVVDVHEKNGEIIHTMSGALTEGETVTGEINWSERFSNMQNHTGEHMVSGIIHKKYGFDNVGFHMGKDYIRIDINGELTEKQLNDIEDEANEAVYGNLPVIITYPSEEELKTLKYRSKKELEGDVRIVEVPGCDICACCGTHVSRTGEIGIIKLISFQRYKGGVRINMLCGSRALKDYREKNEAVHNISVLLSTKTGKVTEAVEEMKENEIKYKDRIYKLQKQLFELKAKEIPKNAEKALLIEEGLDNNGIRELCNILFEKAPFAAVFNKEKNGTYHYVVIGKNDVRPFGKELNKKFNGAGGGKSQMIQGSIDSADEKELRGFVENYNYTV